MRRATSQITRVHVEQALAPGALVALPSRAAHHLAHVLRTAVGDEIIVFDGNSGAESSAMVTHIDKRGVTVKIGASDQVDRETPLNCRLAQAIASGERMDFILQKAVELGVKGVQPLFSNRSLVRLNEERSAKRVAHWREVMASACEQCGRNVIPELAAPIGYEEWLGRLQASGPGEARLLLSPRATQRLVDLPRPAACTLLVGPEGGYTEVEAELARHYGFIGVALGPRVLRTETAALAALSAMNVLWGDF